MCYWRLNHQYFFFGNTHLRRICIALLVLMLCAHVHGAPQGAVPLAWKIDALDFTLGLTDGTVGQAIDCKWQDEKSAVHRAACDGLELTASEGAAAPLRTLAIKISNQGPNQRRLQFDLSCQVQLDGASAQFWDGAETVRTPAPGHNEDNWKESQRHLCPIAAVGDNRHAVLVGLTPANIPSYFHKQFDYATNQASQLTFSMRVVLQPGQSETYVFTAGSVNGLEFGFLRACWQTFQAAFPAYFRVREGVAQNIWASSTMLRSWGNMPEPPFEDREQYRRCFANWEWCYVPFKRAGDMIGREDEWDYIPLACPFSKRLSSKIGMLLDMGNCTLEQFRKDRKAYFAEYGFDCGDLFYTPAGVWVEKQLAETKFPDALVVNPDISVQRSGWVTGYDTEVLVQPIGTSYENRLFEDYKFVAENLDIIGFAFDVFYPGQRNYSPAIADKPIAGRGYDTNGVFYDLGIGMIRQAEFVRALPAPGKPFRAYAAVGGAQGYLAWYGDAALLELTLSGPQGRIYEYMRMHMGSKPAMLGNGWDLHESLPQWKQTPRKEFLNSFARIADYVRLKSFQWALLPGYNYIPGNDRLQQDMPLLVELVRAGWQPLIPLRLDLPPNTEIWQARYGSGAGSLFALANPQEDERAAGIVIHNRYLGNFNTIYVNRRNQAEPLSQAVKDGCTTLKMALPARDVTILRSVLGIKTTAPVEAAAKAAQGIDRLLVTVTLAVKETAPVEFEFAEMPGYRMMAATLDGKPTGRSAELGNGTHQVTVEYASLDFNFDEKALAAFPFLDKSNHFNFSVVTPHPWNREYRRVAGMFTRYFKYYCRQERKTEPGDLSIVYSRALCRTKQVVELCIDPDESERGWRLIEDGKVLRLTAGNESDAVSLTHALLRVLDRTYTYVVPFHPVYGLSAELQHFKLNGKMLSEAMKEEGLK